MARPKKPAAKALPHVVAFRLNNAELARLAEDAAAVGVSPNDLARAKVTGARVAIRAYRPVNAAAPIEAPAAFGLRQELSRVGVNLNQIARRLNMTGEHQPDELKECCRHIDEILKRILASEAI